MKSLMFGAAAALALSLGGCTAGANFAPTPQQASQSQVRALSAVTLTGRIAYTTGTIHIYNLATKVDQSLGVSGSNPKFSPDGKLITYQNSGIRVMNSDGTNSRLLNATGGVPSFDPTGTMIVYSDSGIWRINVDGTGRTPLLASGGIAATYSPDGTQIAYNASAGGSQQLFIMNADGTNAHQVLTSGAILDTVWRPSGKILFGLSVDRTYGYELYAYDPITASLTRLTTTKGNDDEPSWSPDGSAISWTSGSGGIWIMNADGTGQQVAVASSKARQGSWGP